MKYYILRDKKSAAVAKGSVNSFELGRKGVGWMLFIDKGDVVVEIHKTCWQDSKDIWSSIYFVEKEGDRNRISIDCEEITKEEFDQHKQEYLDWLNDILT